VRHGFKEPFKYGDFRLVRRFSSFCRRVFTYGLILAFLHAEVVWALPSGGVVVGGGAVIDGSVPGVTTITQSTDRAIINWQDFSVGAGELAQFLQPGANSAILNRVMGNLPSAIMGEIQANGRVFVLNKNGVVIGGGAVINTNGFVASTLDVPDAEFMGGNTMTFAGDSAAAVVNLGQINGGSGNVVLIARQVENAGTY
jgi:filamentous hemagglutinin family protein